MKSKKVLRGGLRMVLCAFALVGAVGMAQAQITQLNTQDKEDWRYLIENTQPGVPYELNLNQENQYRYVIGSLKRQGVTAKQAPKLFSEIKAARQRHQSLASRAPILVERDSGAPQDFNMILNVSQKGERTYSSTTLSSVPGGTQYTHIVANLYSVERDTIYAATSQIQYADGTYYKVAVEGDLPLEMQGDHTGVWSLVLYVPNNDPGLKTVWIRNEYVDTPTDVCMQKPNYCLRDGSGNCISGQVNSTCTNNNANPNPIKVCYIRGSQGECDYYNQAPGHPQNFVFPVQGYMDFPDAIASPLTGLVSISLVNPNKGGGCSLIYKMNSTFDPSYWSASGNRLSFNFPAAAFPDPTQCLNYYGGTTVNFDMEVTVAVEGGQVTQKYGTATFTSDRTMVGQQGVFLVPPIHIEQGCLAEGTEILMADGKLKAIESFSADEKDKEFLKTGEGMTRRVLGTSRGIEPKPMVQIRTEEGHELMLTETHPVLTPKGEVMAMDLQVGQMVRTAGEPAKLSEVKRVAYKGKVYNLRLGKVREAETTQYSMFANGILVGDMQMQRFIEKKEQEKLARDSKHVLKRLHPDWHVDYRNHLKTKENRK